MISAHSFARGVPDIIANPISLCFKAAASLLPSPVTPTTSPTYFSPVTNNSLSSGVHLAITLKFSLISLKAYKFPT